MRTSGIGVSCPMCGSGNSSTADSRSDTAFGQPTRKRRRVCECGHTYSTYELSDAVLAVISDRVRLADVAQTCLRSEGGIDAAALGVLVTLAETLQGIVLLQQKNSTVNLQDNPVSRLRPRAIKPDSES